MASDELFFSLGIEFALATVSAILILSSASYSSENGGSQTRFFRRCSSVSNILDWSLLLLGVSNALVLVSSFITILISLRGGVFEQSKRKLVPLFMYLVTFEVFAVLVLTIICAFCIWGLRQLQSCNREIFLLELSLILDICLIGFYTLLFLTAYDPTGKKKYEELDKYSKVWWKRLRICCCGCDCATEEHTREADRNAFNAAASVLAQCFMAYDIVPSDIAAGVLLLHGYQSLSLRSHAAHLRRRISSSSAAAGTSSGQTFSPRSDSGVREQLTLQSVRCPPLLQEEKELLLMLRQYSRFYLATYGLLLRNYTHCCMGNFEVLTHDPFTCCREHPGKHDGTCVGCDLSTAVLVLGIEEEDILVSHWESNIFQPVHFVAYDRETNAIIVAVRGTTSLADCITDISAVPTLIPLADTPKGYSPDDYFAHGGMYESAKYVLRSIEQEGILSDLVDPDSHRISCKLIVLGHSLGAGVSLILSTLIWSAYPLLRSRMFCLAYSPPGGVLSEATLEYCAAFTCGCFCGQDMMTRLAQHTFDRFREELFDVLAASSHPKAFLFFNCYRTTRLAIPFHPGTSSGLPAGISQEAIVFREKLRCSSLNIPSEPKKLYPCKRLIHLKKMVERTVPTNWCFTRTEAIYVPVMKGPQDVQAIIASPTMFLDHFPDFLMDVLKDVCRRLENGELNQYFLTNELDVETFSSSGMEVNEPLAVKVNIPGLSGFV